MLSQAFGYAVTALGCVASAGGRPVLVRDIAESCGMPGPYLAKVIHQLSKAEIVTTQRGVGGGVCLARPANQITLMELCVVLRDPVAETRCPLGDPVCGDDQGCPVHEFWSRQRAAVHEYLCRTTIADIAGTKPRWARAPKRPN